MKHYKLKNFLSGEIVAESVTVPQAEAIAELYELKENKDSCCECWVLEPIDEAPHAPRLRRPQANKETDEEPKTG